MSNKDSAVSTDELLASMRFIRRQLQAAINIENISNKTRSGRLINDALCEADMVCRWADKHGLRAEPGAGSEDKP